MACLKLAGPMSACAALLPVLALGAPAPAAAEKARLTLASSSQQRLTTDGAVTIEVSGGRSALRAGRHGRPLLRIWQVETTGGTVGRRTRLTALRRVRAAGTVRSPLTSAGHLALERCAQRRIIVQLRRDSRVLATRIARLAVDAPRCRRFFSPGTVWNTPLAPDAPLDPASDAITQTLRADIASERARRFGPSINTTQYSNPIYTVGRSQPRRRVILDRSEPFAAGLKRIFAAGVPIPDGARPAAGRDEHLVVWQPDTDRMWEFWHLHRAADGAWHAEWGGYVPRMSRFQGFFTDRKGAPWGATASSLPLLGGLITLADLRRGVIDHALAFAIESPRARSWSLPAQRTDGGDTSPSSIPEGATFRLPAALDIGALGLPPLVRMMAEAAQRYGMVVRDRAATTVFFGEDPTPTRSLAWRSAFGAASPSDLISRFPWEDLVLTRMTLRSFNGPPAGG